jgi:hypothetical protein
MERQKKTRGWLVTLTVLVLLSLGLNCLLVFALFQARNGALEALATARNTLALLRNQPFVTDVMVDQKIPLNTTVPIDETVSVPLDIEYPLSTTVNTYIELPALGRQEISIPIEAVIPIQYTLEVPIQMQVPISMTYHLQTQIPVEVEIPPEVRTPLDQMLEQLERGLLVPKD